MNKRIERTKKGLKEKLKKCSCRIGVRTPKECNFSRITVSFPKPPRPQKKDSGVIQCLTSRIPFVIKGITKYVTNQ